MNYNKYYSIINKNRSSVDFEFKEDYVHIYNLYVYPKYRNQGEAKKLLQDSINWIRELNWKDEIQIVCNPTEEGIDKERLRKLYESFGLKVFAYYG